MFRKFALPVLTAIRAAGTVGGLMTSPATASAQPPATFDHDHGHGRFQVLVRHPLHRDVQGTYRNRVEAIGVARRLERQGLDTRIERVR